MKVVDIHPDALSSKTDHGNLRYKIEGLNRMKLTGQRNPSLDRMSLLSAWRTDGGY